MFWIGAAVVVVVLFAVAWWRRRRPARQLYSDTYERARGQSYLQAQHTRDTFGGSHPGP
jgi:hypothetical protein